MINTPQLLLYISIATMEGEIVDVNVRQNQVMTLQFFRHSFELPEAWIAASRLDHHLLAWCDWWLVIMKEKIEFVPS